MSHRIGEVARLSRISIRTLHHYDDIGLLRPSSRSDAGYRLYTNADLEKLRQILFFKTLGFNLATIARLMHEPDFDFHRALIEQRRRVLQQQGQLQQTLRMIDTLLNEQHEVNPMTNITPSFSVFDDFDPAIFEEEVEQRWGDTDAYRVSQRRTTQYSEADWQQIKFENNAILARLAALLNQGMSPNDKTAIEAVEAYRRHIDRWYYPCSKAMHAQLGRMYVSDPRFKATFEKVATGLAEFIDAACAANAAQI